MPLLTLIGQCFAMGGASMAVGMLPLFFKSNMSAVTLQAIGVLGMGLLVGAALAIIIPEGVTTIYAVDDHPTQAIGVSLLAGFALMLLVENCTPHPPHPPSGGEPHNHADDEEHAHPMLPKVDPENDPECASNVAAHGLSATLGLVIHGAADGIALGASSLTGSKNLGFIVFLAILVHKGPAALGLTTTLLTLHLSAAQVRRRLIVFSLAAPAGALLTYFLVSVFGASKHAQKGSLEWWTGVVLLFSGGSFLYVATVIQPISETGPDDHCHDVHHEVHRRDKAPMPNSLRTGLILLGMLLPLILSSIVGHGHDHATHDHHGSPGGQ